MKTLTVRNPWATLIASGTKRIENRKWYTPHRGPLAIHAGKNKKPLPDDVVDKLEGRGIVIPPSKDMAYGAVIAIVNVTDCIAIADLPPELAADPFAEGPWCWLLADARAVTPVPCIGKLRLWDSPCDVK